MTRGAFDPLTTLHMLVRHDVRFVIIGGFGARLWGSPVITNDLDICYPWDERNRDRLAAALHELDASLRGAPEGLPFILDAETFRDGGHYTFTTRSGGLDVLGMPSGTQGFEQLARTAGWMELDEGLRVRVAAIEDLIAMKRSTGRGKDSYHLEHLAALLEERDRGA